MILLAHWIFCATPVAVVAVLAGSVDSSAAVDMSVAGSFVDSPGSSVAPDS